MSPLQRWLLHVSTAVVVLSGLVYGLFKYFGENLSQRFPGLFPAGDDAFTAIHHPLQPWMLDIHVLAAPLLVFAIGWIFKEHVLAKLAASAQPGGAPSRRSGLLGVLLITPMILSGYLLQTLANERLHLLTVAVHIGAGMLFAGAYALHLAVSPKRGFRNGVTPPGSR